MPPYSDNLYSADDSDVESFSDELSPSDGYFGGRQHPQEMMVPDPSLQPDASTAEAKAQEAREDAEANLSRQNGENSASELPGSSGNSHERSGSSRTANEPPSRPYQPSSPSSQSPISPLSSHGRYDSLYTTSSVLLVHSAPPPAYSEATTSAAPAAQSTTNYHTISNNNLEAGTSPRHEAESMGGPPEVNETTPLWRRRTKKLSRSRKCIKILLFVALVLTSFITAIVTAVKFAKHRGDYEGPVGPSPPGSSPPDSGPGNPSPRPKHPFTPDNPPPPGHFDPHDPTPYHGTYCPGANIHLSHNAPVYEYRSGKQLNIVQLLKKDGDSNHIPLQTRGEIILRRLSEDTEDNRRGYVTFDLWATHEDLDVSFEIDGASQTITVYTPYSSNSEYYDECLSVEVNVWLPAGIDLSTFRIGATQLGIKVLDEVDIPVLDTIQFEAISGTVIFPASDLSDDAMEKSQEKESKNTEIGAELEETSPLDINAFLTTSLSPKKQASPRTLSPRENHGFSARETYIQTTSGTISGNFSLFDILSIKSTSGSVSIIATPFPALPSAPKPASLTVTTVSGSIRVLCPIYTAGKIPDREYITGVATSSGSIRGTYVFGTHGSFKTRSGTIDVVALPYRGGGGVDGANAMALETETTSGATYVQVLSPLDPAAGSQTDQTETETETENEAKTHQRPALLDIANSDPEPPRPRGAAPFRTLHATHRGLSGAKRLAYPSSWEGLVDVETTSGSIEVGGTGVRIVKAEKRWGRNRVVAAKGEAPRAASSVEVEGVSGSVEVWVGEKGGRGR